MASTPRYTHDCTDCRFLGRVDKYDLYVCERCDDVTVVARYGDDGPEYASSGFMAREAEKVHREISGMSRDEELVTAIFRKLPSLLLNIWEKA